MYRSLLARTTVLVVLLVGAGTALADTKGDAIAAALRAAPPTLPMTEARREALGALDELLTQPRSERMQPCVDYYCAAIDRALDTLEKEPVTSGVRIFQLYSSSVIVQTPETVFAFDLIPARSWLKSLARGGDRRSLREPDAHMARLASLVDYSFHTHAHGDHVSLPLSKALIEAGKTVVVTKSNKEQWQQHPWAEKLTVLPQTVKEPVDVGPLKVDVLWDHQWSDSRHNRGMPCNAFVVTTPGGLTVMTKGDTNCGLQLVGWLSLLKQRGQSIDVVVGSVIFWRGVGTLPQWDALFTPLWLPGHAWEFSHRRKDQAKGNCAAFVQSWQFVPEPSRSERAQVLSWGEWIDIPGK